MDYRRLLFAATLPGPVLNLQLTYESTLNELVAAREFSGGELPPGVEADYHNLLHELWCRLSPIQQEMLDRLLLSPDRVI